MQYEVLVSIHTGYVLFSFSISSVRRAIGFRRIYSEAYRGPMIFFSVSRHISFHGISNASFQNPPSHLIVSYELVLNMLVVRTNRL
jgi:hypothetical protein